MLNNIEDKSGYISKLPILIWVALVLIVGWFKWSFHELWKDEWQAWFVAKDMPLGQMLNFTSYDGHPALWYLYLKVFSPLSHMIGDVNTINIAHLLTVAGGLYFLIVRFRLPLILRVILAMTYFIGFEYAIINRGYFLAILFVFWAVDIIVRGTHKVHLLGIVLFLLCQTEVYGLFMSICLSIYLCVQGGKLSTFLLSRTGKWMMAGCFVFLLSVFPRDRSHIVKAQFSDLNAVERLGVAFQGNTVNTYIIGATDDTAHHGVNQWGLLLGLIVIGGLYYVFRSHSKLLYLMMTYIVMAIVFSTIFYLGGVRQWGMGFVFLIALLELRTLDLKVDWQSGLVVGIFCVFGMVHGLKAFKTDIQIPFTNAKAVGEFLAINVPPKVPVLSMNKFQTTSAIGYAGRKFYELPDGVEFNHFRWLEKIYLPAEEEMRLFAKFKNVGGLVIISGTKIDQVRYPNAQLWKSFDSENYKRENFYLYSLKTQ
jgi:hypothetical protein